MSRDIKSAEDWIAEFNQICQDIDQMVVDVDAKRREVPSEVFQELHYRLYEILQTAKNLRGYFCSNAAIKWVTGQRLTKEEYYLLAAQGILKIPSESGLKEAYEEYSYYHYEDNKIKGYINPSEKPVPSRVPNENGLLGSRQGHLKVGIVPEDVNTSFLRQDQKEFFEKFHPDLFSRFKRENSANSKKKESTPNRPPTPPSKPLKKKSTDKQKLQKKQRDEAFYAERRKLPPSFWDRVPMINPSMPSATETSNSNEQLNKSNGDDDFKKKVVGQYINFPPEHSIGILYECSTGEKIWQKYAEAKGQVQLADNKQYRLRLFTPANATKYVVDILAGVDCDLLHVIEMTFEAARNDLFDQASCGSHFFDEQEAQILVTLKTKANIIFKTVDYAGTVYRTVVKKYNGQADEQLLDMKDQNDSKGQIVEIDIACPYCKKVIVKDLDWSDFSYEDLCNAPTVESSDGIVEESEDDGVRDSCEHLALLGIYSWDYASMRSCLQNEEISVNDKWEKEMAILSTALTDSDSDQQEESAETEYIIEILDDGMKEYADWEIFESANYKIKCPDEEICCYGRIEKIMDEVLPQYSHEVITRVVDHGDGDAFIYVLMFMRERTV